MKLIAAFILGVSLGFGVFRIYVQPQVVKREETQNKEVLSYLSGSVGQEQEEVYLGPTYVPLPSLSPSPTPVVKPTAQPTLQPTSFVASSTINPSPSPTPTPESEPTEIQDYWSPPEMDPIFARFAGEYGVDKNTLERIAVCESHFNPNARNGPYLGMFQFSSRSWISARSQMGLDTNPDLRTNIEESIRTAAFMLKTRGTSPWPACLR